MKLRTYEEMSKIGRDYYKDQGATFSTCSKSAHKHAGTVRLHLSKGHIAAQINGKLEDWSHKSLIRITHTFEVR